MQILKIAKQIIKDFIVNPFWKNWSVLLLIGMILGLNFLLWYTFVLKIKENPNPFILVSGLTVLNIILANYLWNKEKLASFYLLIIILTIAAFMMAFIKYMGVII